MKKHLILITTIFCMAFGSVGFAKIAKRSTARTEKVNLEVKVDYKNSADKRSSERVMKNEIQLTTNKWELVGKTISEKNNEAMLVLAKLQAHKNNEYTVRFLLVDSGRNNIFIVDPEMKVLAGLPATLSMNEGTRSIDFGVLAVAVNQ